VRVNVDILHKRMSDLRVWVVHPDGTKVRIWNREGGKQQNLHQAFTISAFNGKSPAGKWKLMVHDFRTGATGKIDYWKIEVDAVP
jgi:subtilisin-like proprotein convertase family protein